MMCVRGGLQRDSSQSAWLRIFILAFGLLDSIVSPQYYNNVFRCPTCLMATSVLSVALLLETWMLSDDGGPASMFMSPNNWVR